MIIPAIAGNLISQQKLSSQTPPAAGFDLTNLVAYWDFEEDENSNKVDSINSIVLTAQGTPITRVAGKVGPGPYATYIGNGNSRHYTSPDSALLSLSADANFTICVWVYPTNFGGAAYQPMVVKGTAVGVESDYALYWHADAFKIDTANGTTDTLAMTTGTINTNNQWYFVVARRSSTDGILRVCVNDNSNEGTIGSSVTYDGAGTLYVGKFSTTDTYTPIMYFDQLMLWKRYLSNAEITTLYNSGAGRAYPFN
jgi:hypothetical protein